MEFLLWQGTPAGGMSPYFNFVFIGAMLAVVYFFMIRPQQQQRKKQKDFTANIKRGDQVVTIGGLHGTVVEANDTTVTIIPEKGSNVRLTFQKESISHEMTLSTTAPATAEKINTSSSKD